MEELKIGIQTWMVKNLNVETFRNGDPIPEVKSAEEWESKGENGEPAWCYYDNNSSNGGKFGKLYNWHAVNDSRGLAPLGWKIPAKKDWTILNKNLGGKGVAGNTMKSTELWVNYCGTNESGFNGLPGGLRVRKGMFDFFGEDVKWWSSTESDYYAVAFSLSDYGDDDLEIGEYSKSFGYSVRCLKEINGGKVDKQCEFSLYMIKGHLDDYKVQFVASEDDDYPNYMDRFSHFADCFQEPEQIVSTLILDSKGKEVVTIFDEEIKKIRAEKKSFYIEVRLKATNEVIISFDDNISRRDKVSGPILSINTSFFNKSFIDKFWKEYFKPLLQNERYYSRFNESSNIYPNCEHNIS